MRSVGYSFESAIADLIDNSISAGATQVFVDADTVDGAYVALLDNGRGMSADVAREALRLAGSQGERAATDLGRFGLGLKTASLSQARCLTVATKSATGTTVLRWDIDHVRNTGAWTLLVLGPDEYANLPFVASLNAQATGTVVIWEKLDVLLSDAIDPSKHLAALLEGLRNSLSLVFHRYLTAPGAIDISVNGMPLKPVDPFLTNNPRTQRTEVERVHVAGSIVEVTAYTLPHASGLTAQERRRHDLSDGMRDAQGLYIYRNRRLISYGSWHGLARATELSKQTRIQVDVPPVLDELWQLDIKKSRTDAPQSFRLHLRRIINPILERGHRVHQFRGRRSNDSSVTHVWTKQHGRDGLYYDINLDNPAIRAVMSRLEAGEARSVTRMLGMIAESFPVHDAYQELAGNAVPAATAPTDEQIIERLIEIREAGLMGDDLQFIAVALQHAEPFNQVHNLKQLIDRTWSASDDTR